MFGVDRGKTLTRDGVFHFVFGNFQHFNVDKLTFVSESEVF